MYIENLSNINKCELGYIMENNKCVPSPMLTSIIKFNPTCAKGYNLQNNTNGTVSCIPSEVQSGFTSNIYKSKKKNNVENFSQIQNDKCKTKY